MKTLVLAVTMAAVWSAGPVLAADQPAADPAATGKTAVAKTVKSQTTCPVMRGAIDKRFFADYGGKRVYFCCKSCLAEFRKDPDTYIADLEKDGVTLDKAVAAPRKK
jgi:YHS domain-containing protein